MTVLVVEDDPAVLRSHTKLLEQGGFDVLPAVNGMEAFDRRIRKTLQISPTRTA